MKMRQFPIDPTDQSLCRRQKEPQRFQVTRELLYSLIIPLPCLFVSLLYIFIAYFYIYRDPPEVSGLFRGFATSPTHP